MRLDTLCTFASVLPALTPPKKMHAYKQTKAVASLSQYGSNMWESDAIHKSV